MADTTPQTDDRRYAFVDVVREGRLTIVTLDRPEVLNALHGPAHRELHAVFDDFADDPDQWVAIVTGRGRAFCVGNDLKFQAAGGSLDRPPSGFAGLTARHDLDKPVIAAVNGLALGGGFEIALACDIIVASADARFALPEPKVGMAARCGGLHRLPRAIGLPQAMGMILTGRSVDADEGRTLGFVNAVTAPDQVMAEARRWAADILACSPLAVRAAKRVAHAGLTHPDIAEAVARQDEQPALQAMIASDDFREGPRAFAEKRKPDWTGR
ncbi:enoyl-CoA hydratase/isomerase family protein [Roseomonas aeriglobus]|nr:enoyl-CoA hydratase/isomerase family protein [Roseomonas aeriglobus]